jgi:hypothetical protein
MMEVRHENRVSSVGRDSRRPRPQRLADTKGVAAGEETLGRLDPIDRRRTMHLTIVRGALEPVVFFVPNVTSMSRVPRTGLLRT